MRFWCFSVWAPVASLSSTIMATAAGCSTGAPTSHESLMTLPERSPCSVLVPRQVAAPRGGRVRLWVVRHILGRVNIMTDYIVSSGQVSSGITLSAGDTETVLGGGTA